MLETNLDAMHLSKIEYHGSSSEHSLFGSPSSYNFALGDCLASQSD